MYKYFLNEMRKIYIIIMISKINTCINIFTRNQRNLYNKPALLEVPVVGILQNYDKKLSLIKAKFTSSLGSSVLNRKSQEKLEEGGRSSLRDSEKKALQ